MAPSGLGADRHDTLQSTDGGSTYHFDNQSDDTAQPLKLTLYNGLPHPILGAPTGPITQFPDHMHEGEVVVPGFVTDQPTYDGQSFVEYPFMQYFIGEHKYRLLPEIVAKGTVIGGHITATDEPMAHRNDSAATSGTYDFGLAAVYDGHIVKVGRIAVDSTWHHFFDINLVGDPAAAFVGRTDKTIGFQTPKGLPVLNGMKAYYRNLVLWLAPVSLKLPMLSSIMFSIRFMQPLNEIVSSREVDAAEILKIGEVAGRAFRCDRREHGNRSCGRLPCQPFRQSIQRQIRAPQTLRCNLQ